MNYYIDCDICKNQDSHECDDCIHFDRYQYDKFEPLSPEEIAEREEKNRKDVEEELPFELIEIEVDLPADFVEVFNQARGFTGFEKMDGRFIPIHADDGCLTACDGHRLAQLKCNVPEELQGKNIISLEQNAARIFKGSVLYEEKGDVDKLFKTECKPIMFLEELVGDSEKPREKRLNLPGVKILINAEYINSATDVFAGDITLKYSGSLDPVVFEGDEGRIVVLPLKPGIYR